MLPSSLTLPFFTTLFILSISTQAIVPPSKTFKFINQGPFGEFNVEYEASYRVSNLQTFPFALCFYNTTPNAFTLGLRMGHRRSESFMRWVWDANRGNPVRENATLTFGPDGNLVLADADSKVKWQTGSANKGVVGLDLLPNGNLVLKDSQGKFVWQSFDYPTDTLLVGQALRSIGPKRIVSRLSKLDSSNGPYSFGLEQRYLVMYYMAKNSQKPLLYYRSEDEFGNGKGFLANLDFTCAPETDEAYAFELRFDYNMTNSPSSGTYILSRPKYNSTYSMLRVDIDGNLRIYTYEEHVDWGAWEVTFKQFDRDIGRESECQLPKRCGSLGLCEDDQCVACPRPEGLLGWSKACAPPVLGPCKGGSNMGYYKVVGVEHYTNAYKEGDGPMMLVDCREKCSKDCGCLGFFYREESSKCLLVPELGTLVKFSSPSHVGYIKMFK